MRTTRNGFVLCAVMVAVLLVPAAMDATDDYVRVIPVAGSNEGMYGTHWSTDLSVVSRAWDQAITVRVAFLADAEGTEELTEVPIELAPLEVVDIHDAVAELFGEQRSGALRLASEHPFEATSRTFNDGGGTGVHGEGIPAVDPNLIPWTPGFPLVLPDPFEDRILLGAANRPGEDGERTNIGLANLVPVAESVGIELYDPDTGEWSDRVEIELGPNGWLQQDLFRMFGLEDREVENTMVAVSGWISVYPYLSRVSNLSGDGTYIAPVSWESERTIPRTWEITLTLSYSEGVQAYAFTYGDGIGVTEIVGDPESGWSVTLTFESPALLCYSAYAEASEGGGDLQIDHTHSIEGGGHGSGSEHTGSGLAGQLWITDCIEMD